MVGGEVVGMSLFLVLLKDRGVLDVIIEMLQILGVHR
jgi:hypothetical protein